MSPREAFIALNLLPKIGPVTVKKLVDHVGSAEEVFKASKDKLLATPGVSLKIAETILVWESAIDLTSEMDAAKQRGIRIVAQSDSEYPQSLLEMYDPPSVLYVWGKLEQLDQQGVAMVGSRNYTAYGQRSARQLAFQLASSGITVVSGLARGIDTFSHEGAIAAKGRTIAVIGSGLRQIYPPENMALAEKIADGNGAVVSEFPMNTPPDKRTFPMRNRIVAGWTEGVIVVECPKYSGSLITANLANEMGKPIYAIPGPIDSPQSAGCNELIRNGATLLSSAEELLEDRNTFPALRKKNTKNQVVAVEPKLSEDESKIFQQLSSEPIIIDQLAEKSGLPVHQVSVMLLQMEMKRIVLQLPGQRYVKK